MGSAPTNGEEDILTNHRLLLALLPKVREESDFNGGKKTNKDKIAK